MDDLGEGCMSDWLAQQETKYHIEDMHRQAEHEHLVQHALATRRVRRPVSAFLDRLGSWLIVWGKSFQERASRIYRAPIVVRHSNVLEADTQ
jgi:hypothetical protein